MNVISSLKLGSRFHLTRVPRGLYKEQILGLTNAQVFHCKLGLCMTVGLSRSVCAWRINRMIWFGVLEHWSLRQSHFPSAVLQVTTQSDRTLHVFCLWMWMCVSIPGWVCVYILLFLYVCSCVLFLCVHVHICVHYVIVSLYLAVNVFLFTALLGKSPRELIWREEQRKRDKENNEARWAPSLCMAVCLCVMWWAHALSDMWLRR